MTPNFFKKLDKEIEIYALMSHSPRNNISNHAFNILSVLNFMQQRINFYDVETDFNMAYNDAVQELIEGENQPKYDKPKQAPFIFR